MNMTANLTLSNPSNVLAGQSGAIYIDRAGFTLSFGTNWKLDTNAQVITLDNVIISYYTKSATEIAYSIINY